MAPVLAEAGGDSGNGDTDGDTGGRGAAEGLRRGGAEADAPVRPYGTAR